MEHIGDMQGRIEILPTNMRRVLQVFACLVVFSLPFDNAFFHFFSFLLFISFGLSLRWIGMNRLSAAVGAVKCVHVSFAVIWTTMLISNALNAQSEEAWRTMFQFGPRYWLLFVVFSCLLSWRLVPIRALVAAAFSALALHFIPYIPAMLDLSIFDTRFQGMDRNPNTAGFKAAGLAMLSLYLGFYKRLTRKIRYPLAISLGSMALIALLASGNRGSWVAVFVSSGIFLAAMFPRHPKKITAIAISVGVSGGLMLTQLSGPAKRLALLLDGYSSYRFDVWQNALTLFQQKPLFGHGLDLREAMLAGHFIYHEHNVFLSVLTAMGIAGLLAYLAMLGSIVRLALKYQNYFSILMICMILIVGMFAYDFYRSQLFLAHFVILAVLATQRRDAPLDA